MESVGLRDEDDRGEERETQLPDEPQLNVEPADGEPERDSIRGPDDSEKRCRSGSHRAVQQGNGIDICGETILFAWFHVK